MKHNELKAFIKRKILSCVEEKGHTLCSVDESNSTKRFYIINPKTLKVKAVIRLFCNVEGFSIYLVTNLKKGEKVDFYNNSSVKCVTNSYLELDNLNLILHKLKQILKKPVIRK